MSSTSDVGPDIALVGAARSATSFLAAHLAEHPDIDAGAYKEPNFFGREHGRGRAWYDGLYGPRRTDRVRLDASTSYTSPLQPQALPRLASASPGALVLYCVRDPLRRAVSHYEHSRRYLENERAPTFGAAVRDDSVYAGASDYERWLDVITRHFPVDQILVIPFPLVLQEPEAVASVIYRRYGLPEAPRASPAASLHRNETVIFRNDALRTVAMRFRRSRLFPLLRRRLGPRVIRRARSMITTRPDLDEMQVALASCDPEQLKALHAMARRSSAAVSAALARQDDRLALGWSRSWKV